MLRSVLLKSLRDQRRSLGVWAVSLVVLVGMYVGIYPTVRANTSYSDLINQMPESVKAMFTAGGAGDFSSGPGYLYVEMLSFMGPMLVLIYCVGAGAAALAGEEDRRTFDILMANPVSRTHIVLDKLGAMAIGAGILVGVLAVAVLALGSAVGMGLSSANVIAAMVHLGLLGMVFGALAMLVGALTGRVAASRAVPAGLAVVAYLINALAPTVSWLDPVHKFSPFYQYLGHDPIRHGFSVAALVIAAATIAVLSGLAVAAFRRRDIGG